ncbi:hypothetical protein P170DRAFT_439284 [Aspergillus steynii IBT 23096]|uniref:Glutathione S-transferase UstS-like C-terminal domain-containing protein n=1 Tax=Aspergillus steynii IBT 23096 TaxID=1392250 RepID=A0A2I2FY23_9EURO|nr:uncharacterized protein P170DRAFT_439284 [Aspergillus steynii IBT 23096]PLB45535.1 hypothetical protein P170DRAFT_439284 [Aspergillus steynii IBT 23096]
MDASKPIIFYDIASAPPATCFAPNPWKTRYALNFKGVHYRTEWEELPDVTSVRKKLGAEPNESIWTAVHSTHCLSFKTRPPTKSSGIRSRSRSISTKPTRMARLIPDATFGLQAAFNVQVDAIFTQHTLLALHGIPLNPATAEISKAEFARRAGKAWDELTVRGEERTKMLESFKAAPGELAKLYRQKDGVFLDGDRPSYADLIVGGWLKLYKATMEEWEELESWHDGLWKQLYLALEKYAEVK